MCASWYDARWEGSREQAERRRLFDFLRKRRRSRPTVPAQIAVPSDTRVYAIGDIHGRLDLLEMLHATIREEAKAAKSSRNVVVYLGDYVDRGLDSRGVIDCLVKPSLGKFETVHLKGNHEALVLDFLEDSNVGPKWMPIGGNATLLSYGVELPAGSITAADFERIRQDFKRQLPPEHIAFLESLKLQHVEGDYHFVHAGVRPGRPLAKQVERDLIWIREPFLSSSAWHDKVIVHGHSIEWQPEVLENRIGIDTAAYASGRLSCLVLWEREKAFLFAEA